MSLQSLLSTRAPAGTREEASRRALAWSMIDSAVTSAAFSAPAPINSSGSSTAMVYVARIRS